MTVWSLRHVSKQYRSWMRPPHTALNQVSLDVQKAERIGIIGESGSGKTTLARIGLGLQRSTSGSIHLFGEDTGSWSLGKWRRSRSRAQLLFQDPRAMLNPDMSIRTLLHESARLHRPDEDPERAVAQILEDVELSHRRDALVHQLSGGEQRRAGLARVLLARPQLLVADEPTAGLDANLKAEIIDLIIQRLNQCALVLISHDLPMVLWACTRLVVMHRGEIVDRFAVEALHKADRHPHTQELITAAGLVAPPRTET